ncbi:MAG: chemotaxis protein CheW [Synergistales bacterium]|nr:chemotaxis protein CheW [Synergistales bacterium]
MDVQGIMEAAEDGRSSSDARIILVFDLFKEHYGLDVGQVREIVRVPPKITRVPNAPAYVRGVINLRGNVIPVMDVSTKMGGEHHEIHDNSRIVVVEPRGLLFGFLVDGVREVRNIEERNIESSDSVEASVDDRYLQGVAKDQNGELTVLLDIATLFEVEEIVEEEA